MEFPYTGSVQIFTVPIGVSELEVTLVGASGGSVTYVRTALGGRGAKITATVPVSAGEVFHIYVGGAGTGGLVKTAGFNGGGEGVGEKH